MTKRKAKCSGCILGTMLVVVGAMQMYPLWNYDPYTNGATECTNGAAPAGGPKCRELDPPTSPRGPVPRALPRAA